MSAADFKAKCLKVMDRVATTGDTIVVTKHGRPVARVVPVESGRQRVVGSLKGGVAFMGDLVSPTGEAWSADGA